MMSKILVCTRCLDDGPLPPSATPGVSGEHTHAGCVFNLRFVSEAETRSILAEYPDSPAWRLLDVHVHYASQKLNDPVNPVHYQGDYVMRIIEDFKLDFLSGQVVKYILRAGHKDPELQDLKKAQWYLSRKIANLEKK